MLHFININDQSLNIDSLVSVVSKLLITKAAHVSRED